MRIGNIIFVSTINFNIKCLTQTSKMQSFIFGNNEIRNLSAERKNRVLIAILITKL